MLMGDRGSKEGNYDGTPIIKASGGNVVYIVGNYRVLKILRFKHWPMLTINRLVHSDG
jgi:hypothetical protein